MLRTALFEPKNDGGGKFPPATKASAANPCWSSKMRAMRQHPLSPRCCGGDFVTMYEDFGDSLS